MPGVGGEGSGGKGPGAGGELGGNEGPGGGGGRTKLGKVGKKRVTDPYLRVTRNPIMRGKDTGMTRSTTSADTSGFALDEKRVSDPKNWEYWYKEEYGNKAQSGTRTRWEGGKGGESVTMSNQQIAIDRAESLAKRKGQIRADELEIKAIQAETKEIKRRTLESVPFGSTKTAARIAAQRNQSRRRSGRGLGRPRGTASTLG